jgi:adenosylhomocysteine nucleosidase
VKILVIISADAEWQAVRSLFPGVKLEETPFGECFDVVIEQWTPTFFHGGWGKISAAATAQFVIDHYHPDLMVNLGTCGGFQGRIEQGIIILVEKTIIYDILEQMSDAQEAIDNYSTTLDLNWLPRITPSPVSRGLLVSADRDIMVEDIALLVERYDAVAADWESGAIAWVAKKNNQRLLILRGVSDLVGGEGGEVYGDYEMFISRTKEIMRRLIDVLPKWLKGIEKVQLGYRV